MKRVFISMLATAVCIGAAQAQPPVSVPTPKAPITQAEAEAYVIQLDKAVKKVCARATSPMIGLAFYSYLACLKQTRDEVEKKDPTGLFALRESRRATVVAAK